MRLILLCLIRNLLFLVPVVHKDLRSLAASLGNIGMVNVEQQYVIDGERI
jgi:hypothetical protein